MPPLVTPSPVVVRDRRDTVAVVLLIVLALVAMGRLVGAEFAGWDDHDTIASNRNMNPSDLAGLGRLWTTQHMHLYVPVTYTLWWVMANLARVSPDPGGVTLNPQVYHGLNVLLHATTCVAVFVLLRRRLGMNLWPAAIGAGVFAVHPVQVETVGWTSGTKDLLCGLFSVVAVSLYLKAVGGNAIAAVSRVDGDNPPAPAAPPVRWVPYAVGTVALALGMLSKPTVMVVPLIAGAFDLLWARRPVKRVLPTLAPWLLLSVACAAVARSVQPPAQLATNVAVAYRPLIVTDSLAFYFGKLLWPAQLCVDYGRTPPVILAGGSLWWTWIVPVAVFVAVVWAWRRRGQALPLLAVLVVGFGAGPVLGLVSYDFQALSNVADHYLYVPMVGVAVFVGWLLSRADRAWARALAIVVLVALTARSVAQAAHWQNTEAIFRHALTVNPRSPAAYNSLAKLAIDAGRIDEGVAYSTKAVEIAPNHSTNWLTHGAGLQLKGDAAGAIRAFAKALQLESNDPRALTNIGVTLAKAGRNVEAMPILRKAVVIDPTNVDARLNLGTLYAQSGRLPEAVTHLRAAAALAPNNPRVLANLGIVLRMGGDPDEAERYLRAALAIDPNFAPARAELKAMGK